MNGFSILPLADKVADRDVEALRLLERMAGERRSPDDIAHHLSCHLGAIQVAVCRPEDNPPDGSRFVVTPVIVDNRHVADVYAVLPPDADPLITAARLVFFAPVFAACMYH